jgi:hypothetical protein
MKNEVKYLQNAGIAYVITGVGYLIFGFPFWFMNAVDEDKKGQFLLPFLFLVEDVLPMEFSFWNGLIATIAMFVGAYSLWKVGEPTGFGKNRNFIFVSMAGAIAYILGTWMPLPFAPMGAFLSGLGMIIVGIIGLKTRIWMDWKRYVPLLVGCFPFIFMFPLVILTGARPASMIGLWGFPWILLGIAAWLRAKEVSNI